jgi:toxin YoeB
MKYTVEISPLAEKHIQFFKKSGQKILLKKIEKLIDELELHPYEGTGKPEALKYENLGKWSRRIDQRHRLIYEVFEDEVLIEVISAFGHYDDK